MSKRFIFTVNFAFLAAVGGTTIASASPLQASAKHSNQQSVKLASPPPGNSLEENLEVNFAKGLSDEEYEAYYQIKDVLVENRAANIDAINAARSVCYSVIDPKNDHASLIMVPLPNYSTDLDAACHVSINSSWNASGIAKGALYSQDCRLPLENSRYGGGYTSYVPEHVFESKRSKYPSCGPTNAFICCSPQFPN